MLHNLRKQKQEPATYYEGTRGAGGDRIGLGVLEVLRRGKKQYKIELIALSMYF